MEGGSLQAFSFLATACDLRLEWLHSCTACGRASRSRFIALWADKAHLLSSIQRDKETISKNAKQTGNVSLSPAVPRISEKDTQSVAPPELGSGLAGFAWLSLKQKTIRRVLIISSLMRRPPPPPVHRRRCGRGRLGRCDRSACFLLLALLLALIILAAPTGAAPPPRTKRPAKGDTVSVAGKKVTLGDNIDPFPNVHNAKDKMGKSVIYKEPRPGTTKFSPNEVDATKKAGQLIAHDQNSMIQKKVGRQDLRDYLQSQKDKPSRFGPKPSSDKIIKQIEKQQEKTGYIHDDVHGRNIRVSKNLLGQQKYTLVDWGQAKKPSDISAETRKSLRDIDRNTIRDMCKDYGFKFRAAAGDRGLYRRAGSSCSAKSASGGGGTSAGAGAGPSGGKKKPA
ncbi:hypothetical protein DFJ73DRAFT_959889 [Zopfochytrium polystomum]|nr:hypothetical protein DFJ73DRAFT_959889 [Zopfochytrium polystomum]